MTTVVTMVITDIVAMVVAPAVPRPGWTGSIESVTLDICFKDEFDLSIQVGGLGASSGDPPGGRAGVKASAWSGQGGGRGRIRPQVGRRHFSQD